MVKRSAMVLAVFAVACRTAPATEKPARVPVLTSARIAHTADPGDSASIDQAGIDALFGFSGETPSKQKRGLRAVIDLHGAPGHQNPNDNCGWAGDLTWPYGDNINRTIDALAALAAAATLGAR